eukprot:CAMPEP_0172442382 /NCGR_PEP_ID=MMETSP1065-20121228/2821_1 /TAXON_ID=265537 /ORGANISM="Amphiprora paludosa, Strain CCMP125" /LENGTH=393 /DNA_ID=CAMNT_0013192223 /DNA_START=32 /DNA_END=1213 /DNA_ORIENTATION=+
MKTLIAALCLFLVASPLALALAPSRGTRRPASSIGSGWAATSNDNNNHQPQQRQPDDESLASSRRTFVSGCLSSLALLQTAVHGQAQAVRAVGGSEIDCRAAGNCLEKGELDGALGWYWGAKDRCEATDPTCGAGGKQLTVDETTGQLVGKPVPNGVDANRITHIALVRVDIGREESSVLKIGLYGNDAPASVEQFLDFLSETGFATRSTSSNALGELTAPVAFGRGGAATWIDPGTSIEFGVPSQSISFAKSKGRAKVLDSFVPQPRPSANLVENDAIVKEHDSAGLLSVPKKGLGYGGTGFESDDECFERTFLITDAAAPALNPTRRVIGQVLDGKSMAFLERLSNLPTKRGIRGVIPGQTDGPPLPKVVVRDVAVATVVNKPTDASSSSS